MASKELVERIDEMEKWAAVKGVDDGFLNAYAQLVDYAYTKEDDSDYARKTSANLKRHLNEAVMEQSGGQTIWKLERYAQINKEQYDVVDKLYKLLKYESYYDFVSFMLYMEKNRLFEKRFFQPRIVTLGIVANDLQELEDGKIKFYGLSLPSRVGKAIEQNTPVLTDRGWKKHGDLSLRDRVIGMDGKFKKIYAIHNPCKMEYKVTFSDGESVICHGNHEWRVIRRYDGKLVDVQTKDMYGNLTEKDGHKRYVIPDIEPIEGSERSLPVDPYTLGAWLGDGRNGNPDICGAKTDYAIIEHIIEQGYEISWKTVHKDTKVNYYGIKGLRSQLQTIGMCHSRRRTPKHIPDIYLTSSKSQRLELLAGLLDTDGCLMKNENRYQFTTSEEQLKEDFISLVCSFGWRPCVIERKPAMSSSGIQARKIYWNITFNPNITIPCRLSRKQLHVFSKHNHRVITNIEKVSGYYGNCITVEDEMYCVGRTLKPTHNSTICLFFLAWVGLRRPGSHNAMGGHSGILAKRFFKGLLNIIDTPEYTYQELFNYYNPKLKKVIENKSAEEFTINLGEPDEFSTYTCRGIDGTWTGAVDVSADGYLYVDDLVRDREHSLSPSRMENTYQEYQNKMLDRMNDGARELMVGTLWNVNDPLERERKQYEGDKTRRFRKIPALDDNEQSNFQYEVKGFSTEYYINMRSRLDQAEWMAKFQQQPFVREGLLFPIENLIYFDGYLPEVNTMRVIAALDPAFGKGDHSSMPICADCGSEGKYIIDWVHDARTPGFTVPIIVDKIVTHHITLLKIEENNGGKLYAEQVQNEMAQRGVNFCKIDLQYAPVKISKEDKIGGYSDYILREFRFIQQTKGFVVDDGVRTMYKRSQQYNNAIDEVCLYSPQAKNPKDDAPDSLTQLAMMFDNTRNRIHQTRVIKGGLL